MHPNLVSNNTKVLSTSICRKVRYTRYGRDIAISADNTATMVVFLIEIVLDNPAHDIIVSKLPRIDRVLSSLPSVPAVPGHFDEHFIAF